MKMKKRILAGLDLSAILLYVFKVGKTGSKLLLIKKNLLI